MIGSLQGLFIESYEESERVEVLIDTNGVGYRVIVTPTTASHLGEVGTEVFLYIHHLIREADQVLYGFLDRSERVCFGALLSAHGVGPALALSVLGVHGPSDLFRVVGDEDADALCLVPGVGKKTATRLLVELKGVLDIPMEVSATGSMKSGGDRTVLVEVSEALDGLGYSSEEVRAVLGDLEGEDPAVLLREALQRLARV